MKLGFNLSIERKSVSQVIEEIKYYYSVSDDVIELSLTALFGILSFPFDEIIPFLKIFKYRSIHMPVVTGEDRSKPEFLTYPNKELDKYIGIIKDVATKIGIDTFVVHPDQIKDFNWAKNEFGDFLGFENMDNKKAFGTNVAEMKEVFEKCPNAKFICDINHIFTNDKTMKLASEFHDAFKDRLTHYHVSALGTFHDSFITCPKEISILDGVIDTSLPMVHEGYKYSYKNAQQEYVLIEEYLKNGKK